MSKTTKILVGALVAVAVIAIVAIIIVLVLNLGDDETPADPLTGSKWQVRSYYNPSETQGMASPLAGTQLTAEFIDGQVNGSSGCNTFNAGYTVEGDSLTISQPAATMMMCEPQGVMDQEAAYLSALTSANSFKLEAEQLHILNDKGQVVVDFVPYAPLPDATQLPTTDDSWNRIQAAGKIRVGTAADYPPFESYVASGQIDGFDIALMDEIGRRLGIQVDYFDFAFDGLGPALSSGQIDAAIAAISRTPEREAFVDFSNVYLVSEDGALAQAESDIVLSTIDDIAQYRVGVQRNTVYEEWVQSVLIDAGRMSPDNLFAYEKAEDAVRDLREGRIDLFILDAQAAQAFVEQDGDKLVGKGLNPQNYAIALPKGSATLKAEIDRVITELYNDGTIAELVQRYLGIAQVLPTPTPAPTSTPGPTPECVDGLAFAKHGESSATIELPPGQPFSKVWQVQNTGTCSWNDAYQLVFVGGSRMGGQATAVQGQVAPGQNYDLKVDLVAPLQPGTYQATWQMENGGGQAFGERLKVTVRVVGGPTVTPAPTQTPVAGISFSVDRTSITAGECVTFQWKVDNVKEVYFYKDGDRWQDHGVAGEGSQVECPPVTTTYFLRVVLLDNSVEVRQITISVQPVTDAPQITRFTVDPPGQITQGQCVTARWRVEGTVTKVALTANGGMLWDGAPTSGQYQDCPSDAGPVAYILEAVGPGGTSRGQQNISVVVPATATPVPTVAPELPVIYSFSVSPNQIQVGECVGVSWSVGGGTTYSRILRNGAVIVDDAGFNGQEMDCLSTAGSYTYQLEAQNAAGERVTQQQAVTVLETAPDNPLAGTKWQATALYDTEVGGIGVVLPGTSLTVSFDKTGKVNGSSGCNTYSASYVVNGSQLAITPPSGSNKLCGEPDGIMEQEAAFLAALAETGSFSIEGDQLTLSNAAGQPSMELISSLR